MTDEHPPGESPDDDAERGNVPTRRRRSSPGGFPAAIPGDEPRRRPAAGDGGPDGSEPRGRPDVGGGEPRGGRPRRWTDASDGELGGGRSGTWPNAGGGEPGGGEGRGWPAAGGGPDGWAAAGDSRPRKRAAGGGWRGRAARGSDERRQPDQSEPERAREICLRQLAVRPRTRAELAKALTAKGISAEVVAEVLDRYDEVGIIDDAAFARAWVSSRHHGRGLARRALANELRQRGVAAEVAGEALETLDDEEEAATAKALVERKLRTTSGAPEAVFRRLVGMLARKGYSAGVAIRVVKDALAERDAEAAEFAEQIDPDAMADEATS